MDIMENYHIENNMMDDVYWPADNSVDNDLQRWMEEKEEERYEHYKEGERYISPTTVEEDWHIDYE
jgi:hypothetical protein